MTLPEEQIDRQRLEAETQNFGPHRRPMFALSAPALVLSLGFWNPYLSAHRDELRDGNCKSSLRDKRQKWSEAIDDFICRLLDSLYKQPWATDFTSLVRDKDENPNLIDSFAGAIRHTPDGDKKFERVARKKTPAEFDVVLFEYKFASAPFRLHVMAERRHEYWTLVFCLSLEELPCPAATCTEFKQIAGKNPELFAFLDGLLAVWKDICYDNQHSIGASSFWSEPIDSPGNPARKSRSDLAYEICIDRFDNFVHSLIDGLFDEAEVGHRYANFCGNLFWLPYDGNCNPLSADERDETMQQSAVSNQLQRDFEHALYPKDATVLRQVWPLIKRMQNREPGRQTLTGREIVACYFLDRRALYASSLASITRSNSGNRIPRVVFTLFVAMEDGWQIGRLIDRLCCCGNARLAAMREFDIVRDAGDTLRAIEDKLFTMGIGGFTKDARLEIERKFYKLGSDTIEYRVERVLHYWKQFQSLLSGLRIVRIEGFQPYDQFVKRRLSGSINLVGNIGRRYQLVRQEVDLRYQIEQTENQVRLQNSLVALQRVGEYFAAVSIAYYMSVWYTGLFKGTVLEKGPIGCPDAMSVICNLGISFWYLFSAVGIALLLRMYRNVRKKREIQERDWRKIANKARQDSDNLP
jgi:hypothetical protein